MLFAIGADDGTVEWRTDLGDSAYMTAAVGDGRPYLRDFMA